MSMMVARMVKWKPYNLGGIQKHNQREYENNSNKDIDKSRSHLNHDLVNAANINYRKKIMEIINSQNKSSRAVRKDAVVCAEWIITSDQQFFKGMDLDDCRDFFDRTVDWFKERYGAQNIAYAQVHLDETTPHMHLGVVPMRDGKLQAKNIFNLKELYYVQENLPKTLKQEHGFDIERGRKGSSIRHMSIPEYKEMQEKLAEMRSKAVELRLDIKDLQMDKKALEGELGLLGTNLEELERKVFKELENWEESKLVLQREDIKPKRKFFFGEHQVVLSEQAMEYYKHSAELVDFLKKENQTLKKENAFLESLGKENEVLKEKVADSERDKRHLEVFLSNNPDIKERYKKEFGQAVVKIPSAPAKNRGEHRKNQNEYMKQFDNGFSR